MLVLTRKQQEKIRIGDEIVITVLRMKGKSVRLGIEAPAEVPVLRGELAFEIEAEEAAARQVTEDRTAGEGENRDTGSDPGDNRSQATVEYRRVSRSEAGQVLPQFVGRVGPLRGMLDLRAAAGR